MLKLQADMRVNALRFAGVICLLIPAFVALRGRSDQRPHTVNWTTGFWFWDGSSAGMGAGLDPVDVIYCQAGAISRQMTTSGNGSWDAWVSWPSDLPQAREYWLVLRSDTRAAPPVTLAPVVAHGVIEALAEGRRRGARVAGVQFDIDSPTRALPQYAAFLAAVRKDLPSNVSISITALLDWFRSGMAIDELVSNVDEFVPQFYDLQDRQSLHSETVIAAPIDASRWAPVFNRFKRRFRIGVSTFGRSVFYPADKSDPPIATEISPLDVAVEPSFTLSTATTPADEKVLKYTATRNARIGYQRIRPGDTIEFTLPTRDGMKSAVRQARLMGDYCSGVLFFRWPSFNETVTALPADALAAAGVGAAVKPPTIRAVDGGCAAVYCADLYLLNARPLSPTAVRYRIQTSIELEYFLPRELMPVRMSGPAEIEVKLPAYCGRSRLYLGRAVTAKKAEFRLVIE